MWFLFQAAVFLFVFQTDQWWYWGQGNTYAVVFLGALAALIATGIAMGVINLIKKRPFGYY